MLPQRAGVLDHGAGMSAAFLDYDNDGRLDIYTGNIWSASGLRVTLLAVVHAGGPAGCPRLVPPSRTGQLALPQQRQRPLRGQDARRREPSMGRWAWSSDALDFDSDGWEDLYVVNGMLTRDTATQDLEGFFWRQVVARSPTTRVRSAPYDDALACDQSAARARVDRQPAAERVSPQRRAWRVRRRVGRGRTRSGSGRPLVRRARPRS